MGYHVDALLDLDQTVGFLILGRLISCTSQQQHSHLHGAPCTAFEEAGHYLPCLHSDGLHIIFANSVKIKVADDVTCARSERGDAVARQLYSPQSCQLLAQRADPYIFFGAVQRWRALCHLLHMRGHGCHFTILFLVAIVIALLHLVLVSQLVGH